MSASRGILLVLALVGTGLMLYYLNRSIFGETPEGSLIRTLVWLGIVVAYIWYTLTRRRPS